jgi:hypothetical protein
MLHGMILNNSLYTQEPVNFDEEARLGRAFGFRAVNATAPGARTETIANGLEV